MLIPPPQLHIVRYNGVLSSHAKLRSEVVPHPEVARNSGVKGRSPASLRLRARLQARFSTTCGLVSIAVVHATGRLRRYGTLRDWFWGDGESATCVTNSWWMWPFVAMRFPRS